MLSIIFFSFFFFLMRLPQTVQYPTATYLLSFSCLVLGYTYLPHSFFGASSMIRSSPICSLHAFSFFTCTPTILPIQCLEFLIAVLPTPPL